MWSQLFFKQNILSENAGLRENKAFSWKKQLPQQQNLVKTSEKEGETNTHPGTIREKNY